MDTDASFVWLTLLLLGAFHGINPGMGWLFAVALGLQEQRRAAVWQSLGPLALGHALAIAAAILLVVVLGRLIPMTFLKWAVVLVLFGFGVYRLFRTRHPRYGGMQVGVRDLTVWSFLMASAHGAGLMVLPFIFGTSVLPAAEPHDPTAMAPNHSVHSEMPAHDTHVAVVADGAEHSGHAAALLAHLPDEPLVGLLATLVHTVGYLLIMGLVAFVVYEKVGLRLLRTAWLNLDIIWAVALMATAVVTIFL